mmetsp:Transcript_11441/g.17156  ORF Transcript_11441/g.17156 Transcript_11441/m.17156 type:complete len:95 (+) Transcript_11441:69-353(+)
MTKQEVILVKLLPSVNTSATRITFNSSTNRTFSANESSDTATTQKKARTGRDVPINSSRQGDAINSIYSKRSMDTVMSIIGIQPIHNWDYGVAT